MAEKKTTAARSADAESVDAVTAADEKVMYYNTQQTQHPRYHQPGDLAAAEAANAGGTTTARVDNDAIKPQPGDMPDPRTKQVVKKVEDVNEEIASRPDTGDLGDTGK